MTITISAALADARLSAVRTHLDAGAGSAQVEILSAAGVLLCAVPLHEPCGSVIAGVLSITATDAAMAAASGTAALARIRDGAGEVAIDGLTVSDLAGAGELKLAGVTIYAGGQIVISSLTIS